MAKAINEVLLLHQKFLCLANKEQLKSDRIPSQPFNYNSRKPAYQYFMRSIIPASYFMNANQPRVTSSPESFPEHLGKTANWVFEDEHSVILHHVSLYHKCGGREGDGAAKQLICNDISSFFRELICMQLLLKNKAS